MLNSMLCIWIWLVLFLDISFDGPANINEGETFHLNGKVKFHPSIQLVKWQKYHNNEYIDINIHKPKYRGSTNDIANPVLEIHDFDTEDKVAYRLEVVTRGFKFHSYVHRITMLRNSGAIFFLFYGALFTDQAMLVLTLCIGL